MAWCAWLYNVHRWIGLTAGVLLLFQGCTGLAIVFRGDLNRALHAEALHVAPGPRTQVLQSLLDLVRREHPSLEIRSVEMPRAADHAYSLRLESRQGNDVRFVAVDPYRGAITRDAPLIGWPVLFALELHKTLFLGSFGKTVLGIEASCLLALAIIGPILWWPGRRNLKRALKVKLDGGFARGIRELHRVGGVVVAVLLITTASTAGIIAFRSGLESFVSRFAPVAPQPWPAVAPAAGRALLPIDDIVAAVRTHYGDAPIYSLRFPDADASRVVAFLRPPTTRRPRATDQAWFDGYTAQLTARRDAADLPHATNFFEWAIPVHTGQAFGVGGRIAILVGGLALTLLVASGFLQWSIRRRMRDRSVQDSRSVGLRR